MKKVINELRDYATLVMIVLCLVLALMLAGCTETQKQWGQGDPPAEFQEWFGNDNGARLDFMQNRAIDLQNQALKGIVERIIDLEARPVFGDPNEVAK